MKIKFGYLSPSHYTGSSSRYTVNTGRLSKSFFVSRSKGRPILGRAPVSWQAGNPRAQRGLATGRKQAARDSEAKWRSILEFYGSGNVPS
jgi:hypothetical protein